MKSVKGYHHFAIVKQTKINVLSVEKQKADYCYWFHGEPFSGRSRKKTLPATSAAEAEYVLLAGVTKEAGCLDW